MGLIITVDLLVLLISALIVISKFLDCWTTSRQITNPNQERNPLARNLFKRFGSQLVIWIIFVLTIIIVGISVWLLFSFYNSYLYKSMYIIIGLLVTTAQFAVAYTNKTRKLNFVTKFLMKRYGNY